MSVVLSAFVLITRVLRLFSLIILRPRVARTVAYASIPLVVVRAVMLVVVIVRVPYWVVMCRRCIRFRWAPFCRRRLMLMPLRAVGVGSPLIVLMIVRRLLLPMSRAIIQFPVAVLRAMVNSSILTLSR